MKRKPDITQAQRQLLGPQAADELTRGEQWLDGRLDQCEPGRLGPADQATGLPAGLNDRLMHAIRGELTNQANRARRTRWSEWKIAVAAMVLFALLVGLFSRFMMPRPPAPPNGQVAKTNGDARQPAVAAAQKAVDAYVYRVDSYLRTLDKDEVQVQADLTRLDRSMGSPDRANQWLIVGSTRTDDNPWTAVAEAIEGRGR